MPIVQRSIFIAPENIYLASDRQTLVAESDPRAAILLAAKDNEVPEKLVQRFGLLDAKFPLEASAPQSKPSTVSNEDIKSRKTRIIDPEKR